MNCPNCGKELAEGEVCTCTQENEQTKEVNQLPPQQQQNYYDPSSQQQSYYNPQVNPQTIYPGAYYDPSQAYNNANSPEKLPARTDYPEGYKIKKKYVAVILAATLGVFGIHNFYLGNSSKGIAQLIVATAGTLLFGIGLAVSYVWAIVETVFLLTEKIDRDAEGFKIQTFEEALAKEMKNE